MSEELMLMPCPNDCKHGLVNVFEYPSGNPEESCDLYQVACACACGVRGPLKYTRKEVADDLGRWVSFEEHNEQLLRLERQLDALAVFLAQHQGRSVTYWREYARTEAKAD